VLFFKDPFARQMRRLRRSMEAAPGLDDLMDLDDMLAALGRWAASQPWANELPAPADGGLGRRYIIDCPDLACRQLWFAVVAGDGPDAEPDVLVVLPACLASRGVTLGWAGGIVAVDGDRAMACVALPTSDAELRAIQRLLEAAYSAAFRRACDAG
jgi:hypothetical protein